VEWRESEGTIRIKGEMWRARQAGPCGPASISALSRARVSFSPSSRCRRPAATDTERKEHAHCCWRRCHHRRLCLAHLWPAIRILREYERGVVFTLGRYTAPRDRVSCCSCRWSSRWSASTCASSSTRCRART